jgi:hypothetical protein
VNLDQAAEREILRTLAAHARTLAQAEGKLHPEDRILSDRLSEAGGRSEVPSKAAAVATASSIPPVELAVLMPAPLAGEAAQLLVKMLAGIGLRPEQTLQLSLQMPDWEARLEAGRPRGICALGPASAAALWPGHGNEGFASQRGRIQPWKSLKGTATYEPAALIQDPALKRPAWEDLKLVMSLLKEKK